MKLSLKLDLRKNTAQFVISNFSTKCLKLTPQHFTDKDHNKTYILNVFALKASA